MAAREAEGSEAELREGVTVGRRKNVVENRVSNTINRQQASAENAAASLTEAKGGGPTYHLPM